MCPVPLPHVTAASDVPLPDASLRHTPGTPRPQALGAEPQQGTSPGKRTEISASIALISWVKIQLQIC